MTVRFRHTQNRDTLRFQYYISTVRVSLAQHRRYTGNGCTPYMVDYRLPCRHFGERMNRICFSFHLEFFVLCAQPLPSPPSIFAPQLGQYFDSKSEPSWQILHSYLNSDGFHLLRQIHRPCRTGTTSAAGKSAIMCLKYVRSSSCAIYLE